MTKLVTQSILIGFVFLKSSHMTGELIPLKDLSNSVAHFSKLLLRKVRLLFPTDFQSLQPRNMEDAEYVYEY